MKLSEFRQLTDCLDGDTEMLVLSDWGEIEPAAMVTKADLQEDDPVRETFPDMAILITGEAS